MLTNPTQISLESDSFPFNPEQAKTLMVTSLVESLAERMFPLLVRRDSTKDVTMSVFACSGSDGKESLSSDN